MKQNDNLFEVDGQLQLIITVQHFLFIGTTRTLGMKTPIAVCYFTEHPRGGDGPDCGNAVLATFLNPNGLTILIRHKSEGNRLQNNI